MNYESPTDHYELLVAIEDTAAFLRHFRDNADALRRRALSSGQEMPADQEWQRAFRGLEHFAGELAVLLMEWDPKHGGGLA